MINSCKTFKSWTHFQDRIWITKVFLRKTSWDFNEEVEMSIFSSKPSSHIQNYTAWGMNKAQNTPKYYCYIKWKWEKSHRKFRTNFEERKIRSVKNCGARSADPTRAMFYFWSHRWTWIKLRGVMMKKIWTFHKQKYFSSTRLRKIFTGLRKTNALNLLKVAINKIIMTWH